MKVCMDLYAYPAVNQNYNNNRNRESQKGLKYANENPLTRAFEAVEPASFISCKDN